MVVELLDTVVGYAEECLHSSFVCTLVRFHTASFNENCSPSIVLVLGKIRTPKPHIENKSGGLSFEKTLTKVSSHSMVSERGRLFLTFQRTALPRLTLCLIRRMRQSRGQQHLLLYPMTLLFIWSGLALR